MNVEQQIEIFQACGSKCVRTDDIYWLIKNGVAISLPTLADVYPRPKNINDLFAQGVKVIRFNTTGPWKPLACEFVLDKHPYTLDVIHQKARNQVRKGLERCVIKIPTESELMERIVEIARQTAERQGRKVSNDSSTYWQKYISKIYTMQDFYPYAAFVDGVMVAYVLVFAIEEKIVLYHPFMDREYSKHYPMNALIFTAINETRDRIGPLPVSYGFSSIWDIEALDHFKLGMGFEKKYRLRITLLSRPLRYLINHQFAHIINFTPVISKKYGKRYQRLIEEKELGMKWWKNATTDQDTRA